MPDPAAARYRAEFPIFERCTYLNSCSLGALSRRSRARVNAASRSASVRMLTKACARACNASVL